MRVSEYTVVNLAQVHKALGDPTRLRILHLLAHGPELCVCDIESILEVSQSKASRHLNHLKRAGIVEDRREGTWVYYRITRQAIPAVRSAIREIRKLLAQDKRAAQDLLRVERCRRAPCCVAPHSKAAR